MLNKITFAFALLLSVQVQTMRLEMRLESAGRITDDDDTKDGIIVTLGETQFDEPHATAKAV